MTDLLPRSVLRQWLAGPLPADVALSLERLAHTDDVRYVAVMPDVHLSGEVCTGAVVATKNRLYPHAVGSDVGCGMTALRFAGSAEVLRDERSAARLLAGLYRTVPAIRHPRATLRERLPEELHERPLSHPALDRLKRRDGRVEFATLGRGNHFLEFQADEEGSLWLMLHSGSRAIGQAIVEHHLASCRPANSGLPFLEADCLAGQAYLADLHWARSYADASRFAITHTVANLVGELFGIGVNDDTYLRCNHNHVVREEHFGESLWVHRKGAISAREGETGIIPGSMGTASFHVSGRGCAAALCSSSHGAGRRLSRGEAMRAIPLRELERQLREVWFDVRIANQLRDEAPTAYKDIHSVLRAQRELTRIVRRLRPILSYKGA